MGGPKTRLVKWAENPPLQPEFPRKTYLNREIVGTKAEVVSPTERGVLGPEVHFYMLEEVMVLVEKNKESITKEKRFQLLVYGFQKHSEQTGHWFLSPKQMWNNCSSWPQMKTPLYLQNIRENTICRVVCEVRFLIPSSLATTTYTKFRQSQSWP